MWEGSVPKTEPSLETRKKDSNQKCGSLHYAY